MAAEQQAPAGPDLKQGILARDVPDGGMVAGHVEGDAVLLAHRGREWFAIGAACSHYSGPLAEGLMVGDTVRCPWHHACFSLRTGQPLRAPALNDLPTWEVEQRNGRVFVTAKRAPANPAPARHGGPDRVVIIGGGAAGNSAAETLRREGYAGSITIVDPDRDAPYDRPNLSKDYLAGSAPEEWIPLHPSEFYQEREIDLRRGPRVGRHRRQGTARPIWTTAPTCRTARCSSPPARPRSGSTRRSRPARPRVHYLRTLADSRRIAAAAQEGGACRRIGRELHRARGRCVAEGAARSTCTSWRRTSTHWRG